MTDSDAPGCVDRILRQCLADQASDIYWLPDRDCVRVRCRIQGLQRDVDVLPRPLGEQCLTHLKVLGGLLTYRTQVAQDGVIRRGEGATTAELRIAAMPTLFGERLTLRVLDRKQSPRQLDDLGFTPEVVAGLRRLLANPSGLIILTGPTGCGKTTTIYAMIRELLRQQDDPASIISLEDPIESVVEGISQTAVSRDKPEWGYAEALRAALRQDVRSLIIGEMRDADIVRVVIDAALTGHRVITTYHAGDIATVYGRLLHHGVEPFLIGAAVTGVVAQRLHPGPDGRLHPHVALLAVDDAWRDFIAQAPRLEAIRAEVNRRPGASLQ